MNRSQESNTFIPPHNSLKARTLRVIIGASLLALLAIPDSTTALTDEPTPDLRVVLPIVDESRPNERPLYSRQPDRPKASRFRQPAEATEISRKLIMMVDPHVGKVHSVAGTMIAQYRLPVENSDEHWTALVMYNPELRASCKVHCFDGAVHLIDADGRVYRGNVSAGDDLGLELVRHDEWPYSTWLVAPLMPSVIVEDLYIYHRHEIQDVRHRTRETLVRVGDNMQQTSMVTSGVKITLQPENPAWARTFGGQQLPQSSALHYELDASGRLVSRHRTGEEPETIEYSADTPQHFPLPDPAHGGNWRLHRWQFIEGHNHEALFTAESIRAIIDAWGMQ